MRPAISEPALTAGFRSMFLPLHLLPIPPGRSVRPAWRVRSRACVALAVIALLDAPAFASQLTVGSRSTVTLGTGAAVHLHCNDLSLAAGAQLATSGGTLDGVFNVFVASGAVLDANSGALELGGSISGPGTVLGAPAVAAECVVGPTATPTISATITATATPTRTASATPTCSPSPTSTASRTQTPSATPTPDIPCTCPGDANRNNFVNFADYGAVAQNFGTGGTPDGVGDANCNGFVNFADYGSVAQNFGRACP